MKLIEEIQSRLEICAKATPGPWHQSAAEKRNLVIQTAHITRDVWTIARTDHDCEVNSAFIAASRNQREGELAALKVALEKLNELDQTLRVPAAEYVPAIADAFTIIDQALAQITKLMGEGK